MDQKNESSRKELLAQRRLQLVQLRCSQARLDKQLKGGYNAEAYKQLTLVNYKIECCQARIAGKYMKYCPETLNLNDFKR